jgi:hypothetical protein
MSRRPEDFREAATSRILRKCLGDRFRAWLDSSKACPSPATDPLEPTKNH